MGAGGVGVVVGGEGLKLLKSYILMAFRNENRMIRMKLIVFLGSGVSFESGLPCVKKMTEKLLNAPWFNHADQNFYPGKHPSPYFEKENQTPRIQDFLKILKKFADEYLIKRRDTESTYEDLFFLCQQISDNEKFEIDNPAIQSFINDLNIKTEHLYDPALLIFDLESLASRACDLIQCVVWHLLYAKEPKGLELILELIENTSQLDIATLNHDRLIEQILDNANIKYNDGFGEANGQVRYFNPNLYNPENKINLFKLHDSLNWYRFRDKVEKNGKEITIDRYGMALNPDHWLCRDSNGNLLFALDSKPIFLAGSYNKMLDYNFGIFKAIHNKFDSFLSQHNLMVMSGYGWNDRGINGMLFEWISSSLERRLILLHKNPEVEIKEKSKSAMWHRYDKLVEEGRLIPVKKWFSEIHFDELKGLLF